MNPIFYKGILACALVLFSPLVKGQELQWQIRVQAPSIQSTDKSVFEALEKSLQDLVDGTRWTEQVVDPAERMQGSIVFTITEHNPGTGMMSGTLQVRSSRTVYKSDYQSPLLFFMDPSVSFTYMENSLVEWSANRHSSNLTALVGFYVYMSLGLEAESFTHGGGKPYFDAAQLIVSNAQSANAGKGWGRFDGTKNRYWFIEDIYNPSNQPFLSAWTTYHREGLDKLYDVEKQLAAKESIKSSVLSWKALHQKQPNLFLLQWAIDAKSDEIVSIFSGGPSTQVTDLVGFLQLLDAANANKYLNLGKPR